MHKLLQKHLLRTRVFRDPINSTLDEAKSNTPSTTQETPAIPNNAHQSRVQKLLFATQQSPAAALPLGSMNSPRTYEEHVEKINAEIKHKVNDMLAEWENEDILCNEDGMDSNRDFWFQYKRNDGLRWIAKFFMGRPPTQWEDERHFIHTGITVSSRRARLYPGTVEKNFILAKIIEFFGFVLCPEMSLDECTPNKLFKNRKLGLPFPVFSERMYEKWENVQNVRRCVCAHWLFFARIFN